jgi:hypothetical protein
MYVRVFQISKFKLIMINELTYIYILINIFSGQEIINKLNELEVNICIPT